MPQSSSAANINVDINKIATDLNLKADTNLINATPSSETVKSLLNNSGVKYVVETYSNGSTWYRVYSDGWVEQGGVLSGSYVADGIYTITLLKPMADSNYYYTALGQNNGGSATGNWGTGAPYLSTRTTSNFLIISDAIQFSTGMSWYVCGYAA